MGAVFWAVKVVASLPLWFNLTRNRNRNRMPEILVGALSISLGSASLSSISPRSGELSATASLARPGKRRCGG